MGTNNIKQQQQTTIATFTAFTNAPAPSLLFTTDLAARGLDLIDISHVVQVDPPQDPSMFLHRCGRTARGGRGGVSVVFLIGNENDDDDDIDNKDMEEKDNEGINATSRKECKSRGNQIQRHENDKNSDQERKKLSELVYTEFLRLRGIPIERMESQDISIKISSLKNKKTNEEIILTKEVLMNLMREANAQDRELYEKVYLFLFSFFFCPDFFFSLV